MNTSTIVIIIVVFLLITGGSIGIYYATRQTEQPIVSARQQTEKPIAPEANKKGDGSFPPIVPAPILTTPSNINGRYVKLSNPDKSCMNIGDIEVYSNGENVSKGKNVTMSSVLDNTKYPATFLVDDIFTNFAHTSCNEAPSMTIDLGSNMNIDKIKIYNRLDCCSGRIAGSILQILSQDNVPIFTSDKLQNRNGLTTTQQDNTGYLVYVCVPPKTEVQGV